RRFFKILKEKTAGFTVIELLVAISIFAVIVTLAVGAFIQALRAERRLLALSSVTNNASLALEEIMREVRTGYLFNDGTLDTNRVVCAGNANGEKNLYFKSQAQGSSGIISYSLDANGNGGNYLKKTINDLSGGLTSSKITADNVNVTDLCFIVRQMSSQGNINSTQCYPWRVTILMTVDAYPAGSSVNPMNLETTASSRILPGELPRSDKVGTAAGNCAL
ncbi:MAG: type II secretion system protein, partial [Minisyncoccia bacterium]